MCFVRSMEELLAAIEVHLIARVGVVGLVIRKNRPKQLSPTINSRTSLSLPTYPTTHTPQARNSPPCAVIHLQPGVDAPTTPFAFQEEVLISAGHRVVLQGTPASLPFLDCSASIRCFRVLVRALLEVFGVCV